MAFWNEIGKAFNEVGKFCDDASKAVPVVGHTRALVHKIQGDDKAADECFKASNRTSAGIAGGAAGFCVGGPMGAAGGALAATAAMDATHTTIDSINNNKFTSHGLFNNAEKFVQDPTDVGNLFDTALDVSLTLSGGNGFGKEIGKKLAKKQLQNSLKNVGKVAIKESAKGYRPRQWAKNAPKRMAQKAKRDTQKRVLCQTFNGSPSSAAVYCSKGHKLKWQSTGYGCGYKCDRCGKSSSSSKAWHCHSCQYDLCRSCHGIKK